MRGQYMRAGVWKYTILSLHAAQYGNQRATDAQGMQAFENRVIHTSAVYTV